MGNEAHKKMRIDDVDFVKSVIKKQIETEKEPNTTCGEFTGFIYCPKCGDDRRTTTLRIYPARIEYLRNPSKEVYGRIDKNPIPYTFYILHSRCLQCGSETITLLSKEEDKYSLINIPIAYAGVSSPNCAIQVKYYIDQAYRSKAMGANSAAIAMYRTALENLLFDQGFKENKLINKIKELETEIRGKKGKKWTLMVDTELMDIMREFGNYAVHPNKGDIKKQEELDNNLLVKVEFMFKRLMEYVYEMPAKEEEAKNAMKTSLKRLKENK